MVSEALRITLIGMGGVFVFLLILISGMNLLRLATAKTVRSPLDKVAVAIATALSQK